MAIDSVSGGGQQPPQTPQPQQQQQPRQPQMRRASMTADEQKERRASIQAIMKDPGLAPQERRKSVQALMDGRRRSSTASLGGAGGGMAAAAAAAAAAYGDSSDSDGSDTDADMRGSSSVASSSEGGGGVGAARSRRQKRSSLRNSFIDGVASMNTGSGGVPDAGPASPAMATRRRSSHQSSGSSYSVDPASGHHLGSAIGSSRKMEKTRPHCDHYDRKCTIISPCCGLAFGCRICHDDCPVLPPPIFNQGGSGAADDGAGGAAAAAGGRDSGSGLNGGGGGKRRIGRSASMPSAFSEEETHHDIDRFAIREVICRACYTRQSSKT